LRELLADFADSGDLIFGEFQFLLDLLQTDQSQETPSHHSAAASARFGRLRLGRVHQYHDQQQGHGHRQPVSNFGHVVLLC